MKGMSKRKYLFIALGGVVVLALVATAVWLTSERSPEETVEIYLRALKKGDAAKVVSLADPQYLKNVAEIYEMELREYKQYIIRNFDSAYWQVDFHWEIDEAKITGDQAWVSGTVFVGEKDSAEFNVHLVKRGRKWYLDPTGVQ